MSYFCKNIYTLKVMKKCFIRGFFNLPKIDLKLASSSLEPDRKSIQSNPIIHVYFAGNFLVIFESFFAPDEAVFKLGTMVNNFTCS